MSSPPDGARAFQRGVGEHVPGSSCEPGELVYVGHVAAPGYGVAYRCPVCEHPFVRVGGTFHDATEQVFELAPEDVR